jgi:hypothetical protein
MIEFFPPGVQTPLCGRQVTAKQQQLYPILLLKSLHRIAQLWYNIAKFVMILSDKNRIFILQPGEYSR